ncbi:UDP-glucosyltransferase 2-like [Anopheles nili]|uniref:UDP-glucosyltransferase 2-like n=1 Tax=Anopheles nili TaxID=185578 RepID=UPI00237C4DCA|nr:UDP-glucosyltransferase 2-like [Anopheles nili]
MRLRTVFCGSFLLLSGLLAIADGYNILLLVPFPGLSHWLMLKHFIRELTDRQHEITCITGFPYGEPLEHYHEVLIDPPYPIRETFPVESLFAANQTSDFVKLDMYWEMGINTSKYGLESKNVRDFIRRDDLHFDLILAEQFFQESWLMFAHKYNAPIVTISTYGYSDFFDRIMGTQTPWSFVPHMVLSFDDDMSYADRMYNAIVSLTDYAYRYFWYLPEQDTIAQEAFGYLARTKGPLPSVYELEQSISVILVNHHPILSTPRPTIRGLVDIAGAHIRSPKPLPDDLQKFMDEAQHGVIYFSLGAYMQSAQMPIEKRNAILKVFGSLQQRVIWKFEDDSFQATVPPNVMIRKWAPQNDILAHRNTVLFIAHGGQFGTFEAMHHGVPTLFMPFFGDQDRNADRAIKKGFAEKMMFTDITEETFGNNVRAMTKDKSYYDNAKHVSKLFQNRLVDPMQESIFWIEYVAHYKGAPHLKSKSTQLYWFQHLMLDVLIVPLFLIAFICIPKNRFTRQKRRR